MAVEALIDPATGGVIVVKPIGSLWGRCEVNAVMLLEDPSLEQELAESGAEHVVYPYAAWEEIGQGGDTIVKLRELRDSSLVRVAVADTKAMKIISQKTGILRAAHADMPVAAAIISEAKILPEPEKDGIIVLPDRPLPEKK